MSPVHDTDLAQERWQRAQWQNYELWERVEQRIADQKKWWIRIAITLFLVIASIPVWIDLWPKWMTRTAIRRFSQEINQMKRMASMNRSTYRIKSFAQKGLYFQLEKVENCSAESGEMVREGYLLKSSTEELVWLTSEMGVIEGIPGVVNTFCYDYLKGGAFQQSSSGAMIAFIIIPLRDLILRKLDRISILTIQSPTSELIFD